MFVGQQNYMLSLLRPVMSKSSLAHNPPNVVLSLCCFLFFAKAIFFLNLSVKVLNPNISGTS